MATVPEMNVKQEPIDVDEYNDDDDDLEALRLAALQTIRAKPQSPPHAIPSISIRPTNFVAPQSQVHLPQQKPNFRRHQANPNLIAIVPINNSEPETSIASSSIRKNDNGKQKFQRKIEESVSLQLPQNRYCSSLKIAVEDKSKEVPTKFSRIDASDSESDDDDLLKGKAKASSDDDDEDEDVSHKNHSEAENLGGFASLEDDDSLERLMDVMEQEFNQEKTPVAKISPENKVAKTTVDMKLPVKIKTEKVESSELNVFEKGNELPNVKIKKEIIEEETSVTVYKRIEDSETKPEMNASEKTALHVTESLKRFDKTSVPDCGVINTLKKNAVDIVKSSVVSPLKIRSPREVNQKFVQDDSQLKIEKQHVYVNILSDESSLSNLDPVGKTTTYHNSSPIVQAVQSSIINKEQKASRSDDCIDCVSFDDLENGHNVEPVLGKNSRSPRSKSHELSSHRRSLSPKRKDYSPKRYDSHRSRLHSPNRSSVSPRRKSNLSPRRSMSPRYSRSPVPYSASPSPVRKRSYSRSPIRRRRTKSRSRSWSWSASYSRSRSRSRSPYYRRRSRSPFRRSLSRSPRSGKRYLSPRRLPSKKDRLSPGKREYIPIRRVFSPVKERRLSVSPRSRSPIYTYRRVSPTLNALLPKRLSPTLRMRKSLSPKRRVSPGRLVSPKRSPVFSRYSPKRARSPFSPAAHSRRKSLSPRRKLSPVRVSRIAVSPRRSISPKRSPARRRSPSPKRRILKSPLRHTTKSSISPRRKTSLSPRSHQFPRRQSPAYPKEIVKGFYGENVDRVRSRSPRRVSPVFSPTTPPPYIKRSSASPRGMLPVFSPTNPSYTSVSPKRCSGERKRLRASMSPRRTTELHPRRRSVSAKRSPRRYSPKRNAGSPVSARRSRSPSVGKQMTSQRKSSPLVVRHKRIADHRPPLHRDGQSGKPSAARSRSRSRSITPGKEISAKRARTYAANKDHNYKSLPSSPQDSYSRHAFTQRQRRRRNFAERSNKERENRRRDRPNREPNERDRDRDRLKETKDVKERDAGKVASGQKDGNIEEQDKFSSRNADEQVSEERSRNVNPDPVLEARRRKFESNSPIQPVNKKIRLRTKPVEPIANDDVLQDESRVVEKPMVAVKGARVRPTRTVKSASSQVEQVDEVATAIGTNSNTVKLSPIKVARLEVNKSMDKACSTDDVLDLGVDSLLLMDDEELELEERLNVEEPQRCKPPRVKEVVKVEPKKERKQVRVKPLPRPSEVVDKACSPLISQHKEEKADERLRDTEDEEKTKVEFSRSKEECDLRAELSRRRAERLTKAGSVHESLPKRLLQSAFIGLIGEKNRMNSKDKTRKSNNVQLQSQVHATSRVAPPLRKERPPEGGSRRVLLLNRPNTTRKTALKISFPKGLEDLDSQSDSDDEDDDTDESEDNDQDDSEEEQKIDDDVDNDNNVKSKISSRDVKRGDRRRVKHVPIQLRLGLSTGRCSRRKTRQRKQVRQLPGINLDLHDVNTEKEITIDVTTIVKKS